jgi:hypothetical protein
MLSADGSPDPESLRGEDAIASEEPLRRQRVRGAATLRRAEIRGGPVLATAENKNAGGAARRVTKV